MTVAARRRGDVAARRVARAAGSTVRASGRVSASGPTGCSDPGGPERDDHRGGAERRGDRARHGTEVGPARGDRRTPGPTTWSGRARIGSGLHGFGTSAARPSSGGCRAAGLGVHRGLLGDVVDVLLGLLVELLALVLVHVEVLALLVLHAPVLPRRRPGNRGTVKFPARSDR